MELLAGARTELQKSEFFSLGMMYVYRKLCREESESAVSMREKGYGKGLHCGG